MWNFLISRFIEDVNKRTISFSFFSTRIQFFRIQLQNISSISNKSNEMEQELWSFETVPIHFLRDVFVTIAIVVA